MQCVNCDSGDMTFDPIGGMYYCPNCNSLFSGSEIKKIQKKKSSSKVIEEHTEDVEEENYQQEEEDLNGFSLIVVTILQYVPIFNFLITMLVCNSNVKREYRKSVLYQLFVSLLIESCLILGFVCYTLNERQMILTDAKTVLQTVYNKFIKQDGEVEIPAIPTGSNPLGNIVIDTGDTVEDFSLTVSLLDGVIVSGEYVTKNVSTMDLSQYAVCISTAQMFDRYPSQYRNYGVLLSTSKASSNTSAWMVGEPTEPQEFYTDDYGELKSVSIDDIYNKKYIYYVNPKAQFKMSVLYSIEGDVIGFAFKEMK